MNIKDIIRSRGWSVKEVAESIGMTPSNLSHLLRANRIPPLGKLQAIAETIGISVEALRNEVCNIEDGAVQADAISDDAPQAEPQQSESCCTAAPEIHAENIPNGLVETLLLAVAGLNKRLDAIEEKVDALNCKNAIFSEAFGENKNGKNTIEKIEELHTLMDALYKRIDDMEDKDDSGFSATAPADVRKKIALLPHRFDLFGAKLDEVRSEVTEMLNKCKADGYDVKAMKETMQANALELERIRKISTAGHEEVMGYLEGLTDDHKQMMDKADPNAGRDW